MKILVEGADVAGKTTLINELLKILGSEWHYVHHTQDTNSVDEFLATVHDDRNLVIDRLWLSEQIYGHVMRGESNDPTAIVYGAMKKIPHVLVMCVRRDTRRHLDHFLSLRREEYVKDPHQMREIIAAFHDATHGNFNSSFEGLVGGISRANPLIRRPHVFVFDMDVHDTFISAQEICHKARIL